MEEVVIVIAIHGHGGENGVVAVLPIRRKVLALSAQIRFPDHRDEVGTSGVHDGQVGHRPVAVVALQRGGEHDEVRVTWDGAHDVVRQAEVVRRAGHEGGNGEEVVEAALTTLWNNAVNFGGPVHGLFWVSVESSMMG